MSSAAIAQPPETGWRFPRISWRWLLVAASVGCLAYAGLQVKHLIDNAARLGGNATIDAVPYTEPIKVAVTQKLEGAKGIFQIMLLVMAVLWGLLLAKKDERVLLFSKMHLPELFMFAIANLLFVASAACYAGYTDAMAAVHSLGVTQFDEPKDLTIMDFRDPRIDGFYVWQVRIWVAGMVVTALALVSAHGLLGNTEKESPPCEAASPTSS